MNSGADIVAIGAWMSKEMSTLKSLARKATSPDTHTEEKGKNGSLPVDTQAQVGTNGYV